MMIFVSLYGFFKEIFFAEEISLLDMFRLVRYYYPQKVPVFGFIREEAYTAYIDISGDQESFFTNFKKNTKYEIRRASREGVIFEVENDLKFFHSYYNEFAKSKNLELLKFETLQKYQKNLIITKAIRGNQILAMHAHLYNGNLAILLYSASLFRNIDDNKIRNLIGYANRFLHYEEMLYFKKKGCQTYDFGGYAYNTSDEVEKKINQFKDSFGCIPVQRDIYTSWMLSGFVAIKSIINKLGITTSKL